jgi:hypothetical protein
MYVFLYCGVCTGVRLLPPGENPIAVRRNNNNNNNNNSNNNNSVFYHDTLSLLLSVTEKLMATIRNQPFNNSLLNYNVERHILPPAEQMMFTIQ